MNKSLSKQDHSRDHLCTIVEAFQFVTSDLCAVHPLKQGLNTGIFLSPKIVGNCVY